MIKVDRKVLDELFEDKDVILVGNSVEIMNHELGEWIDSFDTVIRFGKAIEANEKEQKAVGKKISAWLTGEFRSKMLEYGPFAKMMENVPILYNNARWDLSKTYPKIPLAQGSYNLFTDEEMISIYERLGVDYKDPDHKRLSAGAWAILFLCEKIQTYNSLTIVGFDFFAKSTTHRRGGTVDPNSWYRSILFADEEVHSHDVEVGIARHFEQLGMLEWKILSDLELGKVDDSKYGRF